MVKLTIIQSVGGGKRAADRFSDKAVNISEVCLPIAYVRKVIFLTLPLQP